MIWVKVLLTKKWWRRSAKFLLIQLWFRLQMNRYKLWFIALTKHDYNAWYHDTYPTIASYSVFTHCAQFPSRELCFCYSTVFAVDSWYYILISILYFWSGVGPNCSWFSFPIWLTLFSSNYRTTSFAYC